MNGRENKLLLLTVFITGGCVMVLEISAMRLFAPYFGNTLYTTSSVIGVILGALSLGYYWGGRLADKRPSPLIFSVLIALSGLSVLFLHVVHQLLLPLFAYRFSINTGSVLFSISFFLIPNILLGMLSPYAIKIRSVHSSLARAGKNSGEIFFASTVGSIAGSFATGFYLIPTFGVNEIIIATSLLLIAAGMAGFFYKLLWVVIILTLVTALLVLQSQLKLTNPDVVYEKDGVYQKLVVVDTLYRGKPIRGLLQDSNFSSAMYPESNELVFDYTVYAKLAKELSTPPRHVLILGAGAFSLPKYFLETYPNVSVDVVDIEPFLYPISQQYFNVKDDKRLTNVVTDGRAFLTKTDKKYDVIFIDVYGSLYSVPTHFTTKEFFSLVKAHITEKGIVLANVIGVADGVYASSLSSTWKTSFPESLFYAVESAHSRFSQNMMFVACLQKCSFSFQKDHLVNLPYTGVASYIFTDNYAPVDYLVNNEITSH